MCYNLDVNISTLDYNLFKPFIAAYENKNYARAGEQLVQTASAVGMRIKELERQLGIKLFVPHARGVTPTKEADELYIKIKSALAILNNASNSVKEFNESSIGLLRIGCPANIASYRLIKFFSNFIFRYPKVKLEIDNKSRTEQAEMLAKRDLDVVINKMPIPNPNGSFIIEELCELPRSFYTTKTFLNSRGLDTTLTLSQLDELPLILPSKTREDTRLLLQALKRTEHSFTEIDSGNELIYSIIKQNVGIGYINESCVNENDEFVKINVVGVKMPRHVLGVAYQRSEQSKAIKAFINELKVFIASN